LGPAFGAEALLRWRHPVLGDISPAEFIPLVEQTALVKDATDWVIGTAVRQVAEWRARNIDLTVSINVSAANLDEDGFAAGLLQRLSRQGVPPHAIELELTESAILRNGQRALAVLGELQAAGISIAIDDFGTGYSSLSYLQKIPASALKIDRSFMRTVLTDMRAATLVKSMIAIAHDLNYRVVAEGVETAEVNDWLAEQSCDEIQGYFFSRPLPSQLSKAGCVNTTPEASGQNR
jgi:EAL domain-containing protein (putative c-di-GMP-specific phosphodiesterase class I)